MVLLMCTEGEASQVAEHLVTTLSKHNIAPNGLKQILQSVTRRCSLE